MLAFGASLLLPASALVAQDDNEVIEEAKEQRELKRQEQLAAEAEIALLEAEDLEVVAALEAATSLVNLQEAKAQAAEQRLQAALDTKIQAQEDFLAIASQRDIDSSRARRWIDWSEARPIPRFGLLSIRSNAKSSSG